MLHITIVSRDGHQRTVHAPARAVVGRDPSCAVRLPHWRIARKHLLLRESEGGVLVEELAARGRALLHGEKLHGGRGILGGDDWVEIGPYRLQARVQAQEEGVGEADTTQDPRALEFAWRKRLHAELIEALDLRRQGTDGLSDEELREHSGTLVREVLQRLDAQIPEALDRQQLCQAVLDEAFGLGPLEELLADPEVTEIMINRHDEIYVERAGVLHRHALSFTSDQAVLGVIERIVIPLGRHIDEATPMVDARLKNGSRVNAIIPPLSLRGPCLTIRKFSRSMLDARGLLEHGALSPAMVEFLRLCVETRKNVVISGGTGSGKTTLLNVLSNFIPLGERVVTIEDAAELQLRHEHLISLEARPANAEGRGEVSIRSLLRNTLRMRPDRIVVGECRGGEAIDMLQAMNTGHDGSLTTLHANSARDALSRLETMVLLSGVELPLQAIREQIVGAVDVIVQQARLSSGARKVVSIVEVRGLRQQEVQLQELFRLRPGAAQAAGGTATGELFSGCGALPTFFDDWKMRYPELDASLFASTGPLADSRPCAAEPRAGGG